MPDAILDAGHTEPDRNPDSGPSLPPLPGYGDARALVAERKPREPVYCLYPRTLDRVARRTDRRGYSFYFTYDNEGRCSRSWGSTPARTTPSRPPSGSSRSKRI